MWILIDLSFLAHRAVHALQGLTSEEYPTGVLYGVFEQIYSICNNPRFLSNKIVVLADSRHSYRLRAFKKYKYKRREDRTEEEWEEIHIMRDQVKLLTDKILPSMGIQVHGQKGLESDDHLAWASQVLTERKEEGVMITSDGDIFQSITDFVSWYDPQRDLLHNPTSFIAKKHIKPSQWGLVKAIGGCTTDSVPGLTGVGEKGAIDYINGEMPEHYKKYQTIQDSFTSGELDKWKELVVLPHKKTRPFELKLPKYNPDAFFEFCEEYDIDSYLSPKGMNKWKRFFKGRFNEPRKRRRLL